MRGKALVMLALAALLTPLAALPAGSTVLCFGQAPTIVVAAPGLITTGTAGNDVILGTAGNDTIRGLAGDDRICGRGGDDVLEGNAGTDRLSGGDGDDVLRGGSGVGNQLFGAAGDDTIIAIGPSDTAHGGGGNDFVDARNTSFSVLDGGPGRDTIYSGYRSDLDAGPGIDHCGLGMDVEGVNCETVELQCGTAGDPLPSLMVDMTSATGDFDGNGLDDTLYVYKDGSTWVAHIETDAGFGAETVLPSSEFAPARAIGGRDINRDGVDEAFMVVETGASSEIVGIYTLYEPVGSPTTGLSCGLVPVVFSPVPAEAGFVIDYGIFQQSGLYCRPGGGLREFQQETLDGFT